MRHYAALLELPLNDHISHVIAAMQGAADQLGLGGQRRREIRGPNSEGPKEAGSPEPG